MEDTYDDTAGAIGGAIGAVAGTVVGSLTPFEPIHLIITAITGGVTAYLYIVSSTYLVNKQV